MATRRESRYMVVGRPTVHIDWSAGGATSPATEAELLDISRGGAKLAMSVCPQIGAAFTLHVDDLDMAAQGTVCWSQSTQENRWWVACAFDSPLPAQVLPRLLQAGYLERRHDARESVEIPATARWQLGEQGGVSIRDFSAGGLCLTSPRASERGQRMLLHLGDAANAQLSVVVQAQWCIEFDDGYLIGCSFVHREGLDAMRRMAALHQALPDDSSAARAHRRGGRLERFKSAWQSLAAWADRDR